MEQSVESRGEQERMPRAIVFYPGIKSGVNEMLRMMFARAGITVLEEDWHGLGGVMAIRAGELGLFEGLHNIRTYVALTASA